MKKIEHLFIKASKAKLFNELYQFLLSPKEHEAIEKRLQLIGALLSETLAQRQIAEDFHISIAKITRGSNALKEVSPKLRKFLKSELGAKYGR